MSNKETPVPKPVFDKDGRLVPHSELERRRKKELWLPAEIATAKEGLPKCPEGWDAQHWFESYCNSNAANSFNVNQFKEFSVG